MSAPAQSRAAQPEAEQPQAPHAHAAEPAKKGLWRKKPPKQPKPRKPRQPWGIAPWLFLSALVTGAAAVAVLYYPIPGLTAKPPGPPLPAQETKGENPVPFSDLVKREQAVAQKEAELAAREEALIQKEEEATQVLKELGVTQSETVSLRRAANMYSAMAPYKAAPLMAQLDVETALQILRLMTDEQAAEILSQMDPDRGARIMRELTTQPTGNSAGG